MTGVPSFVSELVRAANEVGRLTDGEIENLLLRAITTIQDLRDVVGIPVSDTEHDAVIQLKGLASAVDEAPLREVHRGLLQAADMIRTLWIVVDSGTVISLTSSR